MREVNQAPVCLLQMRVWTRAYFDPTKAQCCRGLYNSETGEVLTWICALETHRSGLWGSLIGWLAKGVGKVCI